MPHFPTLRRARGYYGRRPAVRSGGYKRFARRGPRRVAVRGRVAAPRIMSNPSLSSSHNIVAPRYFTNIEYGFSGELNTASGYQFTVLGNGLQTPGNTSQAFTTGGLGVLFPATHALNALQPVGFSALSTLYASIRVWESTITVSMVPITTVGGNGYSLGGQLVVFPTSTEEALTDVQLAQSLPYAKHIIINSGGAQKDNTIIKKMDTRTIYGLSDAEMMANPNYTAGIGGNPSFSWWWNVIAANFTNSNIGFQVIVRVNYRVEFFDPKGSEADT